MLARSPHLLPTTPPLPHIFSATTSSADSLFSMTDCSGRVDRDHYELLVGLLNLADREELEIPRPSIDSFPAEILGRIFEDVVFVPGGYAVQLDRRHGNPYDITLVSRHWRDVGYSAPQLWVILPGHHPQWWDRIIKRSGTLPLRIEWYKKAPIERQPWPLMILADRAFCGRLQGLKLEWCGWVLKNRMRSITPSSSLRHVHLTGGSEYKVWNDRADFLDFVQGVPSMSYLGLEGGCIPEMAPNRTVPTKFSHPSLRWLDLRGWAWRVFQFLEATPLRTLERLELRIKCLQDISEIGCRDPQRVFRDFWEGRREAPRSLTVIPSEGTLEITLRQCKTPGRGPGYSANALLLKLTATGFRETAQMAWKNLVKVMPLEDVEGVTLHDVPT